MKKWVVIDVVISFFLLISSVSAQYLDGGASSTIPRDPFYITANPHLEGEFFTNDTDNPHTFNGWILEWQFWKREDMYEPGVGWAEFNDGIFTINAHLDELPPYDVLYAAIKQFEKGFRWNPYPDYWQWESFRAGDYPNAEIIMYGASVSVANPLYPGYSGIIDLVFEVPSEYKGVEAKRIILVDLYFNLNGICAIDESCFKGPCNIEDYEDVNPENTIYHKQYRFQNHQKIRDILIDVMNEAMTCGFYFDWQDAELVEVTWGVEICNPYSWTTYSFDITGSVDFFGILKTCRKYGESCDQYHPCCSGRCRGGVCIPWGGGCPILKAFDGEEFQEIEKLNIHSEEGVDTVYSTSFKMKPYDENIYKIILHEKWYALWEGSHIDYVELIDSEGKECELIEAKHSKLGDITSLIKESDDERVEIKPGERIELTYGDCEEEEFELKIEGYNHWRLLKGVMLRLGSTNVIIIIVAIIIVIAVVFGFFKLFPRFEH